MEQGQRKEIDIWGDIVIHFLSISVFVFSLFLFIFSGLVRIRETFGVNNTLRTFPLRKYSQGSETHKFKYKKSKTGKIENYLGSVGEAACTTMARLA